METRANYVAVGIFVLAMLAGIFVAALWFARVEYGQAYTPYVSYFSGSAGVNSDAVVRINGILVGRVRNLSLDPGDHSHVAVSYEVETDIVLHQGASASVGSGGLTGQSYLQITDGPNSAPPVSARSPAGRLILPTTPSILQRLEETAPEITSQAAIVLQRLTVLLAPENLQAISETLANLRAGSAVLSRRSNDLDQIVANGAKATHGLVETLDTLKQTTADLRLILAHSKQVPDRLDTVLVTLNDTTKKLGGLSSDLDATLRDSRPQLHQFSQTGLAQLTALSGEMRVLVSSLSHLSEQIDRDPDRLVFGDRREGYTPR